MPVYNGSAYIAEAIESILAQTFRDFHLIVVDNCSTDNTAAIVRKFDDPRIVYVCNSWNLGLVGNANRCLELADGQYVCIFHHDDVMLPDNLERKVRLLDEHPDVGFVHSDLVLIDPEGKTVAEHIWYEDSRENYIEDGAVIFRKSLDYMPLGSSIFIGTVMARRTCYETVGAFRAQLPHCNDSEMWMRMMLFFRVACIGSPLVKYRVHPASTTTSAFGDYASITFLREHFLAVELLFEAYDTHIPDAAALRTKITRVFANRALSLAGAAFDQGNAGDGRQFMKEAMTILPGVMRTALFWKIASKRAAGPDMVRFFRRLLTHRAVC